jgi:hypothetical protein
LEKEQAVYAILGKVCLHGYDSLSLLCWLLGISAQEIDWQDGAMFLWL